MKSFDLDPRRRSVPSLSPPILIQPLESNWYFDVETKAEKTAGNLPKLDSTSSERSSSSSVQELQSIQDLCSATKRVSREDRARRAEGKLGHSFVTPLGKQLFDKLDKLDLLSTEQHRVSVIARTPSRAPATSTPSCSPQAPPVPPRSCQSVGQAGEAIHSEICSDISSINNEVFEAESVLKVPIPKSSSGSVNMGSNPVCHIVGPRTPEEEEVLVNEDALYSRMRQFSPAAVTPALIAAFDHKMEVFEKDSFDLTKSISRLLITKGDVLGVDRVSQWRAQRNNIERDVRDYTLRMFGQASQVRAALSPVQVHAHDLSADSNFISVQAELLALKKAEKADRLNETIRENEAKKNAATNKVEKMCKAIFDDFDYLDERIKKVDDWTKETDLSINRAMTSSLEWKRELEKVIKMKREVDSIVADNGLHEDAQILQAGILVNRLTEDVRYIIELIRTEDDSRELYTLDAAKTDSVKLPTFGGRDDEDFVKFKAEVEEAFVQNRVSKSTKLKKLREVLTGQAKKLVPESLVGDIEKAWDVLDKAFGNPRRLMNYKKEALFRLGKLPSRGGRKAQVAWYLEVESLVKDILSLVRNQAR